MYIAAYACVMSSLACGLESVNSHGPSWTPLVSLDPPAVKMSSPRELTASVANEGANEAPPPPKTALLQSSPATAGSSIALPSSSNGPLGRFPVPPPEPGGSPKMFERMTALTVTDSVTPAASETLLAVNKSPGLIDVVSKVDEKT